MLWDSRFLYPPLFQLSRLVASGAIDSKTAADWATKDRYPPEVVKKLEGAVLQALNTEAVKERLDAVGAQLLPGPGQAFGKWYLGDVERWAKLVRDGRIQPID
jgi:hypothetical protein